MVNQNSNSGGKHAKRKSRKGLVAALCAILLIASAIAFLILSGKAWFLNAEGDSSQAATASSARAEAAKSGEAVLSDRDVSREQERAKERQAAEDEAAAERERIESGTPTPLIAEYDGVLIHSPVKAKELEGILFHQASGEYALVMATQLPDADPDEVLETGDYEIAEEQPVGDEWLIAKALHLWREQDVTEMDTSIDVGGEAGTDVLSPVTGTVVLVRTYMLYDTCEDYEIHIQPDGRPDLDVVEIHVTDVCVKPGDKVMGGETPIAKIRDLAAEDITDIQLSFYSKEGHGNHTHVQVNNADAVEYRETRLEGAYKVD